MRWIDDVTAELGKLRGMLEQEDSAALEALVEPLGTERDKWLAASQVRRRGGRRSGDSVQPGPLIDRRVGRSNPAKEKIDYSRRGSASLVSDDGEVPRPVARRTDSTTCLTACS